jgi:hypothetical protein
MQTTTMRGTAPRPWRCSKTCGGGRQKRKRRAVNSIPCSRCDRSGPLVPDEGEYVAKGSVDFFGDMGLRVSGAGGPNATARRVEFCIPLAAE